MKMEGHRQVLDVLGERQCVQATERIPLSLESGETKGVVSRRLLRNLSLGHEGIAQVQLAGCEEGHLWVKWMEVPGEVSLESLVGELSWNAFLPVLRQCLLALGHGHARGVIHGGVHPGRISLVPHVGQRHRARIYDFGLLSPRQLIELSEEERACSAPEAKEGSQWRPATDLYSVGAIAARWLYGRVPLSQDEMHRRNQQHFVPPGLGDWLGAMMRPDPGERFQLAADALHGLEQVAAGKEFHGTVLASRRGDLRGTREELEVGKDWWRVPKLYGFREFPLIGRERERRVLWHSLLRVTQRRRPGAVVISGPGGVGKTRLMRWLCHRASELGVARSLILPENIDQLGGQAVLQSLRERLPGLARPWILCVDDAHCASETLDWIQDVMEADESLPILVVVTVTDERLVERPVEAVQVTQLLDHGESAELAMRAMPNEDFLEYLHQLLPLSEEVALHLANRLGGNPLLGRILVRRWLGVEAVFHAEKGHVFKEIPTNLPEDLLEGWGQRVLQTCDELANAEEVAEDHVQALEVAAVLGLSFSQEEWREVCRRRSLPASELLIRALLAHAILVEKENEEARFEFSQSLVREWLLRRAEGQDRSAALNQECVCLLQERGAPPQRVGEHLLGAGREEDALDALMMGIRDLGNHGRQREALALQSVYQRACDRMKLPANDRRRVLGELRKVWSAHGLGLMSVVWETLERIRGLLDEELRQEFMGRICWLEAGAALAQGDLHGSEASLREAQESFLALGDKSGLGGTLLRLGTLLREQGRLDEAQESYRASRDLHREIGDGGGAFAAMRGLATINLVRGQTAEAELLLRASWEWIELSKRDQADMHNLMGEIHRQRMEWEQARIAYEAAANIWRELGDPSTLIAQINQGMALVEQGRHHEAQKVLDPASELAAEKGCVREQMYAFGGLLPCLAASGQWLRCSELMGILEAYIRGNAIRADDFKRMFSEALRQTRGRAPGPIEDWVSELCGTQDKIDLDLSVSETKRRGVM